MSWLGSLPAEWKAKRLKYVSTINDEALPETTDPDYELLYVDIGSVEATAGIQQKETLLFETAPSRARRIVRDGDTIVSTVRTYLRAIAPIEQPEENLIVSTGFAVVRPKGIEPKFLGYCLRSSYFIETIVSRSVGVSYPATNPTDILCIEIPLPPKEEQQAIADFLDAQTAKIDTLLAKKRQLIEKLKEKRSALIARTVTRGLPPAAAQAAGLEPHPAMKDSGVEWLGQIPAYWQMKRLTSQFKSVGGGTPSKANSEFWDGDIPWVSPKDMSARVIADTEDHITLEAVSESATRIVPPGVTLVVVRSGILRHTIPAATNLVAMALNQDMKALIAIGEVTNKYLVYFIEGHNRSLLNAWTKSGCTVESIESSFMLNTLLPIPPGAEQQAIAAYLDRETARIDQLAAKVEAAITRLTEYRQALITAAVTGKIDVRALTPTLSREGRGS